MMTPIKPSIPRLFCLWIGIALRHIIKGKLVFKIYLEMFHSTYPNVRYTYFIQCHVYIGYQFWNKEENQNIDDANCSLALL